MRGKYSILFIVSLSVVCFGSASWAEKCLAIKIPPELPKITRDVFPGEGWSQGKRKVVSKAVVYDTWEESRRAIATLDSEATVDVMDGLIVVKKPDIVRVTKPIQKMRLDRGDIILRYAYFGEGEADLWVNGCWYGRADAGFIKEMDGSGCQGNLCAAQVTKSGIKKWWLRIQLPNGRVGWSLLENFSFVQ